MKLGHGDGDVLSLYMKLSKYYGLPPYDKKTNPDKADQFFYSRIFLDYSHEQIQRAERALGCLVSD